MQNTLVLALHGFLGEGSDWNLLKEKTPSNIHWLTPNLFSDADLSLVSFDKIAEHFVAKVESISAFKKVFIGYSLGGRIGLHLLKKKPELFDQFIFLSTHPGMQMQSEKMERQQNDLLWVERLQSLSWEEFLSAWNQQPVFKNSVEPVRSEGHFLRERLIHGLTSLSLSNQDDMRAILKRHHAKIKWVVGSQDAKFLALAQDLEQKKILSSFERISSGHRILFDSNLIQLMSWL